MTQQDSPGEDPRLALFGRYRGHRLEAETVRDCILAVSGQLNPARGGPPVYPPVPRAVMEGQSRPGSGWGKSTPREAARRSIYVHAKRTLALPELELLDAADSNTSCEQRPVSTTAPQALTFLNGVFLNEQARHFAERLKREAGNDPKAQVVRAFALALCRTPSDDELGRSVEFLRSGGTLAAFCLVLMNTNEFFYVG